MHKYQDPVVIASDSANREYQYQAPFKCSHCSRLSVAEVWGDPNEYPDAAKTPQFWHSHGAAIVWTPASVGGRDFPDVPDSIASAADEAYKCHSINAFRAAILLARGVVEATAKDKGIASGTLYAKIEAMCKAGIVRSFTKDAAHELRFLGNDMAHGDFVAPTDADDSESVLSVMSEILNEVYQGPARVTRMQAKRTSKN